jgi:hypothetical protein
MGRFLKNLVLLGLVAWGGWWLWGFLGFGAEDAGDPEGEATSVVAPGAGPLQLTDGGKPKPGTQAASAAASAGARELRKALEAGDARGAVRRARGMEPAVLRSPAVARLAREAALTLAESDGAGPADRVSRADEARRLLGALLLAEVPGAADLWEPLEKLNREVLFCHREVPGTLFRHDVKAGDTLDGLLRKTWKGRVHAGYGLVLYLNSIPSPDRLRAKPIYVPEEPVRILVRKKSYQLWVLLGEVPIRRFDVGLGMQGRTPEGRFEIEELLPKPDYWPPNGGRVSYGHPDNPLGSRWLGFRDTPEAQGFGIHGTSDPSSIGKDLSQGCVRLRNGDVERLFTWVTEGTRVDIQP